MVQSIVTLIFYNSRTLLSAFLAPEKFFILCDPWRCAEQW